ncbi:MAG: sulfur carrier protein ThiS [Alphaproteobacteria bacterium]|nr:sulfur carrier protein ThiS [Alphaproteobacteria bacterium]
MQLSVNGELKQAAEAANLRAFLADLGIDPRKVAVERNREIVPRSLFEETLLSDGDQLEIVEFVGGG